MQEITSSYDDLEKRMAIYLGLGALLFTSLYLFTQGADLWTYLIRGVLALSVATIIGWAYGRWLRDLFRRHATEDQLPENVERQSRDAQAIEGRIVTHAEMPEAIIPAELASSRVEDYTMPDFETPVVPPAVATAGKKSPTIDLAEEGDLPPPPVPSGI